jgi:septal ring factor EnvC (AmiA/AmiB activator)
MDDPLPVLHLLIRIFALPTKATKGTPPLYKSCTSRKGLYQLILCTLVIMTSHISQAETETEYQQRLQTLGATIKTLQSELRSTKDTKNKLQNSLQESEERRSALTKKVNNIKEALAREKKSLNQLQSQRNELKTNKQKQKSAINVTIRQAYKLGQQSQLQLLLNQESPQRIDRLMRYHDYIVAAHQEKIVEYTHTLAELISVTERINASSNALVQQRKILEAQQQALANSKTQRLAAIKKISQSLRQKGQQLSTLNADQQRLQRLLEEAINTLSNLQLPSNAEPFKTLRGKLAMPAKGKILLSYGKPQFEGKLKRNGILIGSRMGTDVVSVHYGRVIFSDYLRGHGLLLILDHGDGYMSLYGHNETLLKEVGEWASAGEQIATVGNSGGHTQVGLYFEIRHKGKPQNPQPWLKS